MKYNIFSGVQKQGNFVCIKNFSGIIPVHFHVSAHDGNIFVTISMFPHQPMDFPGNKLQLLSGICQRIQFYFLTHILAAGAWLRPEQVLL